MSDLFDKSIRTLELPRVLELLSEQAVSAEAKQRPCASGRRRSREEVLRLLDQTDAARNLIGLRGSPSFSGVKPVAEALDPGGPGRRPEHSGAADHRGSADRRPPGQGVLQRRGGGENRHRPPVPLPPRQPLSGRRRSSGPSRTRTPSPTPPARSWRTSAATCGRPRPRAARSFKRSSPPPAMGKFCRRPSSPSGTAASWCR